MRLEIRRPIVMRTPRRRILRDGRVFLTLRRVRYLAMVFKRVPFTLYICFKKYATVLKMALDLAPCGSNGVSNTRTVLPRCSAALYWSFTLFNYDDEKIGSIGSMFSHKCEKWIFQEEKCPDTGRLHLQGSISLITKGRPMELFREMHGAHWEKSRSAAADNYCMKSQSATGRRWQGGNWPKPIKTIATLRAWQKQLSDYTLTEPDDRTVIWIYDPDGGIGKTALLKYWMVNFPGKYIFCNGGKCADLINLVFNQNMDKCDTVVWDLPRNRGGMVSYDAIECIKNGMIANTKYETGVKIFNCPHVVIFANELPSDLNALSRDRWRIFTVSEQLVPYDGKLPSTVDFIDELSD